MNNMIRKYKIFILVFLFWLSSGVPGFGQKYDEINKIVMSYSNTNLLKNSQWALYAKYYDTDEVIIAKNENMSVAPASGLKLITSSAALEILGEHHRFDTYLYYEGVITDGSLDGNIVIVGGGDPCLGSDAVEGSLNLEDLMDVWMKAIEDIGIVEVKGSILADDLKYKSKPVPDHWEWIDLGNYYAASSTALSINDNLYHLYFKPGSGKGVDAEFLRTEPVIPGLTFTNYMKTGARGSGDNGYVYSAPYQFNAVLRGTIPAGSEEFSIKGSIPDPALFTAQYLTKKLNDHYIRVIGKPGKVAERRNYDLRNLIIVSVSPPVRDIVYILNKRSNNVYAELLLKAISFKLTGIGSTEDGIKHIMKFLQDKTINTDGLILYDGSGLSRSNAVTAKIMVDLLMANTDSRYFESFHRSLSVVGDPEDIGFYKDTGIGTAIEKKAWIKSGLILGVRSYSGYIENKSGRAIVFSFIANNYDGSGSEVNRIHRELMIKLAELK
jgi:D-alanyl-D-alanine carboxypeptidase/D-alanyl-D-alanine-endopeptidase (penicillin-binding protein 4)